MNLEAISPAKFDASSYGARHWINQCPRAEVDQAGALDGRFRGCLRCVRLGAFPVFSISNATGTTADPISHDLASVPILLKDGATG